MKNLLFRGGKLLFPVILTAVLVLASCEAATSDDTDDTIPPASSDLTGAWIAAAANYTYDNEDTPDTSDDRVAASITLDISGSAWSIVFYGVDEPAQFAGSKGTYTGPTDGQLVLTETSEWDDTVWNYVTSTATTFSLPVTLSGDTLTLTLPNASTGIAFTRRTSSIPTYIAGTWTGDDGRVITYSADGTFTSTETAPNPFYGEGTFDYFVTDTTTGNGLVRWKILEAGDDAAQAAGSSYEFYVLFPLVKNSDTEIVVNGMTLTKQ